MPSHLHLVQDQEEESTRVGWTSQLVLRAPLVWFVASLLLSPISFLYAQVAAASGSGSASEQKAKSAKTSALRWVHKKGARFPWYCPPLRCATSFSLKDVSFDISGAVECLRQIRINIRGIRINIDMALANLLRTHARTRTRTLVRAQRQCVLKL